MVPVSIAIDGPAGAGKSTVARMVAERLHYLYVDTGAMYRAVAYLCVRYGVDAEESLLVEKLLGSHSVTFQKTNSVFQVFIDGVNVTRELRSPQISGEVSAVAAHSAVRTKMTQWQRSFAQTHCVVMDGRDIGTVVLPDATVKVFLTADVEERARRRLQEYRHKGYDVPFEEIVRAVAERDEKDRKRLIAPLAQAHDAVRIDTTGKSIDQVVNEILQLVENAHVR